MGRVSTPVKSSILPKPSNTSAFGWSSCPLPKLICGTTCILSFPSSFEVTTVTARLLHASEALLGRVDEPS